MISTLVWEMPFPESYKAVTNSALLYSLLNKFMPSFSLPLSNPNVLELRRVG